MTHTYTQMHTLTIYIDRDIYLSIYKNFILVASIN